MSGLAVAYNHEEVRVPMRNRMMVGPILAGALLLGCATAAEPFKSGPQTGEMIPGAFHPLNVTGDAAGQKFCQV